MSQPLPNSISIGSAVFAQHIWVTNTQTMLHLCLTYNIRNRKSEVINCTLFNLFNYPLKRCLSDSVTQDSWIFFHFGHHSSVHNKL